MHTSIAEVKKGDRIIGFYFLKSLNLRTSKNNNKFLDMIIADTSGEMDAKKWDIESDEEDYYKQGDVVKVEMDITQWQSALQAKVVQMRKVEPGDPVNFNLLIPTAPMDPQEMLSSIEGEVEAMECEDLQKMCRHVLKVHREKLLYYPAAKVNHHSFRSGLLYHMIRMIKVGKSLCEIYEADWDLLLTGIIFHDMEKLTEMKANKMGVVEEYTKEGILIGHLVEGVVQVDILAKELGIDPEKALLVKHMVLSHHMKPEFGSPKAPMFLEAELLHFVDILDARVFDFKKAVENVQPGRFSERIFSLEGRTVYRVK